MHVIVMAVTVVDCVVVLMGVWLLCLRCYTNIK